MLKTIAFVGILAAATTSVATESNAQPVDYVRICDLYGAGYYYVPGTDTCVHAESGETRRETAGGTVIGQTDLAQRLQDTEHQTAISNALEDPDLVAGENFGVRVNWGAAGQTNALGVTGMAVISQGLFDDSGRLTASGGIAFSGDQIGGRAGLQLSW